jgi:uncharacterized protein
MISSTNLSNRTIKAYCNSIIRQMNKDSWKPDYVLGVVRGGLIPSVMISHYLDIPVETVKIDTVNGLSDDGVTFAKDVIGYIPTPERTKNGGWTHLSNKRKNVLILDSINMSGHSLSWLVDEFESSVIDNPDEWNAVWGNNARIAVLVNNEASAFKNVHYSASEINTLTKNEQVIFPWERWTW